jgi:hypothetical protein
VFAGVRLAFTEMVSNALNARRVERVNMLHENVLVAKTQRVNRSTLVRPPTVVATSFAPTLTERQFVAAALDLGLSTLSITNASQEAVLRGELKVASLAPDWSEASATSNHFQVTSVLDQRLVTSLARL